MSRTSSSRRRPSASRPKLVQEKLVQEKPVQDGPSPGKPAENKRRAKLPTSQTPLQRELSTKRRGELAELAFILKAANLGFGVARPFGDSERYDVILDARELGPRRNNHVGRTLPSAPLNAQSAAGTKNTRKNQHERTETNAKNKAKAGTTYPETTPDPKTEPAKTRSPKIRSAKIKPTKIKKTPRRQSVPISAIPDAPDPSPPLWRVQVKCSTQLSTGLYRINAHRRLNGRAVPYLPGEIHFFAAYIIPEDTWYIIPLAAARGVTSLLFRRRRDPKPGLYDAYREAWHLLRP